MFTKRLAEWAESAICTMHKLEHHIILCLTWISDAGSSVCWTNLPSTDPTVATAGAPTQIFFSSTFFPHFPQGLVEPQLSPQ